jgi:hypothetical protein
VPASGDDVRSAYAPEAAVGTIRLTILSLALVFWSATGASGQHEDASQSAPTSTTPESGTAAPTWLDEQTRIDPDFIMPRSASGGTVGYLFNCAKALGLSKGDPDFDAYDFLLMKRTVSQERWTDQRDEAGRHIGSRYHAFGTDRLYDQEESERVVEGTFDISVMSTLIDADVWGVEKQGILWDFHGSDEDFEWTWSVDITMRSEGAPQDPTLDRYRGVERSEFQALCECLK